MLGISCLDTQGLAGIITALFGLIGVALMLFGVASLMAVAYRIKRSCRCDPSWLLMTGTESRSSNSGTGCRALPDRGAA